MVLAELSTRLQSSLRKLNSITITPDQIQSVLNDICRALIEADVSVRLVKTMKDRIKITLETEDDAVNKKKLVQKAVQDELVAMLSPATQPYKLSKKKPNVIMFVGLQGAGKTTTIAKYAGYHAKRGWKVAMVCCDSFRAGAFDQLKQNATKLRVPFYGSYTEADPVVIAEEGVKSFRSQNYEIILIDTSGRHRQEAALFEEMQEISAAVSPDNTVFVMDGTQGQAVFDQATEFQDAVNVGSVIVTKLDGHAKGGGAISAVAATGAPISFLGTGEHFDEFEAFNAKSFVSKLLGFGDIRGIFEEMRDAGDNKAKQKMQEEIGRGKFTLRSMYTQFESMSNMGGLGKIMGAMPGMSGMGGMMGGVDDKFKRMQFIMNSMSDSELDGIVDLHVIGPDRDLRIRRIAVGSGSHPSEVEQLLKQHKAYAGAFAKMGKASMNNPAMQKQLEQIKKNPAMQKAAMEQARKQGFKGDIKDLIKEMEGGGKQPAGGGGMGGLESMMGGMGGGGDGGGGGEGMGGMGDMMQKMMASKMGDAGGMPGMPPGMDMGKMNAMVEQAGGMENVMKMMGKMGMGGMGMPPGGM